MHFQPAWTLILWTLALCFAAPAMAYPSATADRPFYVGVYIYEYRIDALAKEQKKDYFAFLEPHLKLLQEHGVNAVYLGGASRARFAQQLKLFAQYGMAVIPQLDFAYFNPKWDDKAIASNAKAAAAFINQYADEPNVLAFSVREEVPYTATNGLARYYAAILAQAPNARFQLINNNLGAATDLPVPDPVILGTDRYAFWWEYSGGGYLASPAFSLNWVRQEADRYYWQAARRGSEFSLVVTQGGWNTTASAQKYAGDGPLTYPKTKEEQDKLRQRVRTFAAQGRMGWNEYDTRQGKRFSNWKYYRLPENCMKALAWTSVLQGAKSFYIWSYTPPSQAYVDLEAKRAAAAPGGEPVVERAPITLAGLPGKPNPQFEELTDASREIRAYQGIITRMTRSGETLIENDQKNIFHNAFVLPGFAGRVVVLHNASVGTWPANSAAMFKDTDDIRIDEDGNLAGYKALKEPAEVTFTLKTSDVTAQVYDVRTDRKLAAADHKYTLSILPGSGVLVFIGSEKEAQSLAQWMPKP